MVFAKVHQLEHHENVSLSRNSRGVFECGKCGVVGFTNRVDFVKHSLLCFYPHLYTCKTCHQTFDNYPQYLFHTRYIHTHVVYMCAICSRKYKHIKELIDHDQLMHSKSLIYCEICFESIKSRQDLYEHYNQVHLVTDILSTNSSRKQSTETNPIQSESLSLLEIESHETNPTEISHILNADSLPAFVLT